MKHVLVVDNDSVILETAKQTLQNKYIVSLLNLTNLTTDTLSQYNPDLIILSLSEKEGFHQFELVKEYFEVKNIPIIVLTEQMDCLTIKKALHQGAVDVITKPFIPEMLLYRVNIHMELNSYREDKMEAEKFQDAISVSFAELVEFRDETTGGHLKNTTLYFRILLEEVIRQDKYKDVISIEDVKNLLRSAPLHDIGKIGINDDILRKASPLDYHEYEYMKTHTTLGKQAFEKIIKETGGTRWLYLAKDIAYCHHERWDGTGYPNGLKGEEIPLYARILTIADVYDALTSRRSYKEAYSHQKAMNIIIEGKGSLFDPELVDLFVGASDRFEQALLSKEKES